MPNYVNKSGIVVCINPENEEKAVRDGLRPVTEDDMQWARGDRSRFALPKVDGYERGELGDQPVYVIGCGPSMLVESPGKVRIQCNPRANSLPARFAIALDGVYWDMDHYWAAYRDRMRKLGHEVEPYTPRFIHYKCQDEIKSFNMPVRVIRGQTDEYLEVRTQHGIQKAHFTGIAAVLFAQYLTTGPVILLGFDLDRPDAAGNNYLVRQEGAWKVGAELWNADNPRVFAHKANVGAIHDWFPLWEGE